MDNMLLVTRESGEIEEVGVSFPATIVNSFVVFLHPCCGQA